jgi:alpha-1,2-mannosyltransferase
MGTIYMRKGLKFAVAAIFLLWSIHLLYALRFSHDADYGSLDFRVYFFSAQLVHQNHHADLYAGALDRFPLDVYAPPTSPLALQAARAGFSSIMLYIYPPLLADLLAPVSSFAIQVAAKLWLVLNLLLVCAAMLPLAKLTRIRILSIEFVVLLCSAFCFHPIQDTFSFGQLNVVLCALWAFGIWAYERKWVLASAVILALATALKVTPLIIFPLFIIWKDRRWLVGYFLSLTGFGVFMGAFNGFSSLREFLQVGSSMSGGAPIEGNQCISTVLAWFYYGRTFNHVTARAILPLHALPLTTAIKLTEVLFYGLCLWLVWKNRSLADRRDRASLIAIFALVSLSISPVSWQSSYAIAIIPLVMQAARWFEEKAQGLRLAVLALASALLWSSGVSKLEQLPLPAGLKVVAASAQVFAVLAFCIVELAALRRPLLSPPIAPEIIAAQSSPSPSFH